MVLTEGDDMSYRTDDETSRRVIDIAIGILVGLRGCSEQQAFEELVRVVNQTGIGIGTIAGGLVALARGSSSAAHAEAFAAWGELINSARSVPASYAATTS
jgi:ANTAR domain